MLNRYHDLAIFDLWELLKSVKVVQVLILFFNICLFKNFIVWKLVTKSNSFWISVLTIQTQLYTFISKLTNQVLSLQYKMVSGGYQGRSGCPRNDPTNQRSVSLNQDAFYGSQFSAKCWRAAHSLSSNLRSVIAIAVGFLYCWSVTWNNFKLYFFIYNTLSFIYIYLTIPNSFIIYH